MSASAGPVPFTHLEEGSGLSAAQVRAIWRAVALVRTGKFDVLAAHAELIVAGYTALEADVLVQEMIERLAES